MEETETEKMCQQPKYFKSTGDIVEENSANDSTVADAAKALCCKILRYEKCTRCGKDLKLIHLKEIWFDLLSVYYLSPIFQ